MELSVWEGFWKSWMSWLNMSVRKFDPDDEFCAACATLLAFTTVGAGVVRGADANAVPETA